jgi:hypothetical protein
VQLEGLSKLKTFIHLTGSGTRDLPACSLAALNTTLPRAPYPILLTDETLTLKVENIYIHVYIYISGGIRTGPRNSATATSVCRITATTATQNNAAVSAH